jgi:hypothetical protein
LAPLDTRWIRTEGAASWLPATVAWIWTEGPESWLLAPVVRQRTWPEEARAEEEMKRTQIRRRIFG